MFLSVYLGKVAFHSKAEAQRGILMHFAPGPPGQEVSASPGQVPGYHRQPPGAGQAPGTRELRPPGLRTVPKLERVSVCVASEGRLLVHAATLSLFVVIDELGQHLENIFPASSRSSLLNLLTC